MKHYQNAKKEKYTAEPIWVKPLSPIPIVPAEILAKNPQMDEIGMGNGNGHGPS